MKTTRLAIGVALGLLTASTVEWALGAYLDHQELKMQLYSWRLELISAKLLRGEITREQADQECAEIHERYGL